MDYVLKCMHCEEEFDPQEVLYTCPKCKDRLGTLELCIDYAAINVNRNEFEKYAPISQFYKMLPVTQDYYKTHLHVGGTPLYRFKGLMGIKEVLIKYDGGNPTASYKDRATFVALAKAYEFGFKTIYCASTGNAASSLAGLSASTDLDTVIFLPASAPIAKISQLYVYGAKVVPIKGSYDEAFDISLKVGEIKGWYSRNSAINPYLLEGKKTGAYEIAIQNNWKIPDIVLVSVGDGTVISSLYKGFYDFIKLGLTDKMPVIIGVQAKGSDAVKRAFDNGDPYMPCDISAQTLADSISVGMPRDVIKACKYVKKSGGYYITVKDSEILHALETLSQETGVFAEPAGATAYAGLIKLIHDGKLDSDLSVCVVVTGSGLKDVKAVESLVNVEPVEANLDLVLAYLKKV